VGELKMVRETVRTATTPATVGRLGHRARAKVPPVARAVPYRARPVHMAANPNARIAAPETAFTALMARGPTLSRNKPTPVLKSNHHNAEPANTPPTKRTTEEASAFAPTPTPAKIAPKERIVVGLVSVRKNVEA
jgi:hypothetical protein